MKYGKTLSNAELCASLKLWNKLGNLYIKVKAKSKKAKAKGSLKQSEFPVLRLESGSRWLSGQLVC